MAEVPTETFATKDRPVLLPDKVLLVMRVPLLLLRPFPLTLANVHYPRSVVLPISSSPPATLILLGDVDETCAHSSHA